MDGDQKRSGQPDGNSFLSISGQEIYLYGAGNLGKKLYQCLKKEGISPLGFIDRAASRGQEIPMYRPRAEDLESVSRDAVILLAGLFGKTADRAIRHNLEKLGFSKIYGLHELDWQSIESAEFLNHLYLGGFDPEEIFADRENCERASKLFDDEGQKLLKKLLHAYEMQDVSKFPLPLPMEEQYLGRDIPEHLDFSRFIDCGAYNGDTLRSILEKGFSIQAYASFEPQLDFCERIAQEVLEAGISERHILPLGASDSYRELHFSKSEDGRSAAKADAGGTESLCCAPIDGVLGGFRPTLMKMDIEGMELEALRGAKAMIQEEHPILEICVYHKISHLWEIPLYIHELYPHYRCYLRNYQFMGLETVMYAFP